MDLRGQFSQFSGVGAGSAYPNPFFDMASLSVPSNMRSVLQWSEYVYSIFGTYRMAMERILSYFLTEIDIKSASDVENKKWKMFLNNTVGAMTALKSALNDRMCYGNAFMSMLVPTQRWLICPKCGYSGTLEEIYNNPHYKFQWQLPNFVASCPSKCKVGSGYRGKWVVDDRDRDGENEITVKRWNPHEIEILHDPLTDDVRYLWRIPEDYKKLVRDGHLFHLERVTKQVLEAIRTNTMFRFHKDVVFHMKEPTLAGIVNRGWGLPRILYNFRQIWYVQVLRRFNEAIALDYVVPFRVITPAPAQGNSGKGGALATDPLLMYNGGDFRNSVKRMVNQHRRDPGSLQVLGFPVNFQMFGADAAKLAPRDLLDQGMETLLNDAGTPVELYNGSLQLQSAPVALRLFESTWRHLVYDANMFLQWLVRQVSQLLSWESVEAELKRVTIADNIEEKMIAAQMMMQNQLSGTTVYPNLGYDWKQEQDNLAQEAQYQAKLQARTQEEMDQEGFAQQVAKGQMGGDPSQQGGAPAGGGGAGAPMGGAMGSSMQGPVTQYLASVSPNVPQTPTDMMAVADSLAQQLMGLPESIKDSELRRLSQANPVLHSIVKKRMEQMREESRKAAGMQQGSPQGGGMAA